MKSPFALLPLLPLAHRQKRVDYFDAHVNNQWSDEFRILSSPDEDLLNPEPTAIRQLLDLGWTKHQPNQMLCKVGCMWAWRQVCGFNTGLMMISMKKVLLSSQGLTRQCLDGRARDCKTAFSMASTVISIQTHRTLPLALRRCNCSSPWLQRCTSPNRHI